MADLSRKGWLRRVDVEVDAHLEAASIARRAYQAGGPAVLLTRVKGCRFPMVCNLFGTMERARWIFRDTLDSVRHLVELRTRPEAVLRRPWRFLDVPRAALRLWPRHLATGPVMAHRTTVGELPQLVSWPRDGGAFVTLPQVYTEDPERPGWARSNLGMYRVQLSGGQYRPDAEVGLHYQIHRGIGIHHAAALKRGQPLRVVVSVGGPPALMMAAVMPLPEGMPEVAFAGALAGERLGLVRGIPAEADFAIVGTVDPDRLLPEGPFGDHLGYYSLAHDFPVMRVEAVYHRPGAIWPFTTVGRPPQEDTTFGALIHELTGPLIPTVLPGVKVVHAVDAAGVHPLLLALGSERYTPYQERRRPQEVLTQANAILGQGQLSLAKYLLIAAHEDAPGLDPHDVAAFFQHVLRRVDWRRDLHFQTQTTIDTLDYSGSGLNAGSKVVIAAVGEPRRELATHLPSTLPPGLRNPQLVMPGVVAVEGALENIDAVPLDDSLPLWVLVDDARFTAATLTNFLWVTFTRSNPAPDISGQRAAVRDKHWGCEGPLFIDARMKPHHAPPLEEDADVVRRVEALAAPGGPLHGVY